MKKRKLCLPAGQCPRHRSNAIKNYLKRIM